LKLIYYSFTTYHDALTTPPCERRSTLCGGSWNYSLVVIWPILAVTLWLAKPAEPNMQDFMRLLPDLLRLLKRLAVDPLMARTANLLPDG
jgi:hypothetical protein